MQVLSSILFIVSLIFAHTAMAQGDDQATEKAPISCQQVLESEVADLSEVVAWIADRDMEAIKENVTQLKLSPRDWLSVANLSFQMDPQFFEELIDGNLFSLDNVIMFKAENGLFKNREDIKALTEHKDFKTLDSSIRKKLAYSAHDKEWFLEVFEDLKLSEDEKLDVVLQILDLRSDDGKGKKIGLSVLGNATKDGRAQDTIEKLNFKGHENIKKLFMKLAAQYPNGFSTPFREFNESTEEASYYLKTMLKLPKEASFEILITLYEKDLGSYETLRNMRVAFLKPFEFSSEQTIELVATALINLNKGSGDNSFQKSWNRPTEGNDHDFLQSLTAKEDVGVVLKVLEGISEESIANHEKRDKFLTDWLSVSNLARFGDQIYDTLFRRVPFEQIMNSANLSVEQLENLNLFEDDENKMSLSKLLTEFAHDFPDRIDPEFVEVFWDHVRDSQITRNLIDYYYNRLPKRGVSRDWKPNNSLELISKVVGLNYELASAEDSKIKANNTLYSYLLEIQKPWADPVFADVNFTPEAFADKELILEFLSTTRNYFSLKGTDSEKWLHFQKMTGLLKGEIGPAELGKAIKWIKKKYVQMLKKQVEKSASDHGLEFTYEDVQKLMAEWGDIEPVLTLLSRFAGTSNWDDAIPVILEAFRRSLAGDFEDWKFFHPSSHDQLHMFSTGQMKKWTEDQTLLKLANPDEASVGVSDEVLKAVYEPFESRIRPFLLALNSENPNQSAVPGVLDYSKVRTLIDEFFKKVSEKVHNQDPVALVHENFEKLVEASAEQWGTIDYEAKKPALYRGLIVKAFEDLESQFKDLHESSNLEGQLQEIGTLVRVLKFILVESKGSAFGEDEEKTLKSALEEIGKTISNEVTSTKSEGFVFSVISAAPKLLMTAGDLVDCTSCQNYKSGNMIDTLMGNVIDANIKVMASFHLSAKSFGSIEDFYELVSAYGAGKIKEVKFDGNKRIVHVEIEMASGQETKIISTEPLENGYLRQMLKAGHLEGLESAPVIFLEKEYSQNHQFLENMRENHKELFKQTWEYLELPQDLEYPLEIKIHASRNKSGMYSDAAGGRQTEDYKVYVNE